MTRLPHRLLQRALALGILAVVAAGLFYGVVLPVLDAWASDDELDHSRLLLSGYQRVATLRPQIERDLAARRQEEAAVTGLWPGATPAIATSALQAETRRMIEAVGGQILGMQPLPASQDGGFDRIGVQLQLSLPMPGLPALLRSFDAHTPYLFLDKVDLRASDSPGNPLPVLTIRSEVSGYHGEKPV